MGVCVTAGPSPTAFGPKVLYPPGAFRGLVVPEVHLGAFAAAHADGVLVIDVRERCEYVAGHGVHVRFVGSEDHLQGQAGQAGLVWLRSAYQTGLSR
jgi:hypothetical protein